MSTVGFQVCHHVMGGGDIVGQPCRSCGHTDIAHPSYANPGLAACAICLLQAAAIETMAGAHPVGRGITVSLAQAREAGLLCESQNRPRPVNYETGRVLDPVRCVRPRGHDGMHLSQDEQGNPTSVWAGQ